MKIIWPIGILGVILAVALLLPAGNVAKKCTCKDCPCKVCGCEKKAAGEKCDCEGCQK